MVNLERACDSCGKMIGGASKYCPQCQIYVCFLCSYILLHDESEKVADRMPYGWWKVFMNDKS